MYNALDKSVYYYGFLYNTEHLNSTSVFWWPCLVGKEIVFGLISQSPTHITVLHSGNYVEIISINSLLKTAKTKNLFGSMDWCFLQLHILKNKCSRLIFSCSCYGL